MKGKSQLEEIEIRTRFDLRTKEICYSLECLDLKDNGSDAKTLHYAK